MLSPILLDELRAHGRLYEENPVYGCSWQSLAQWVPAHRSEDA
jgi:hypothetical protein